MTTTRRAEEPHEGTRRSPTATAVRWVTGLALAVAAIGVLVLSVGTFTGWLSVQTVPTGSMEPAIPKGSAIVVDPVAVDDVAVGDVIVFAAPTTGTMTVHRVAEIEQTETGPVFTTKGDANAGPDPWRLSVDGAHLHRVRMAVPLLGKILLALSAPTTRIVLAGLGALLVLGFGLSYLWRRPNRRGEATGTWDAALDRMVHALPHPHLPHPHLHHPHLHHPSAAAPAPTPEDEVATVAEAVEAARRRSLDPLVELLAQAGDDDNDSDTGPANPAGPHPRVRRVSTAGTASLLIVVLLAGAVAWLPARTANAALTATTAAGNSLSTLTVPAKTSVGCSWDSATNVTVSWTNPNATDSAQVLVANTSGGATSVGATALAGATTVAYAPVAPLTTVRYLSTKAVDGTWTSTASPEMPTNTCRRAVNAYAGNGTAAFAGDGGNATAASLNVPLQSFEAPDGRVFVADSTNNRIRVIATNGTISTFAGGTGAASACTFAGPVASLRMNAPRGVAVDAAGNVYIADSGAACIRMVDPAGNVTRFAGGGATTTCNTAVAPTALSLSSPSGLAIDTSGALIVADTGRNCVRRLTATTTAHVAGGGGTTACGATTATAVSLSGPLSVAVDASNNVYIADTGRNCVRKVAGTTVSVAAGGGATTACTATTTSTAVSLSAPQGVAVDGAGTVYVADTGRRCVRQVVGTTVTQVGFTGANSAVGDNGPALGATIRTPSMLSVLSDGDLLVSDRATNAGSTDIRRIELS